MSALYREEWVGKSRDEADENLAEWWTAEPEEIWRHAKRVADAIEQDQLPRRTSRLTHARLYGNREFRGFGIGEYSRIVPATPSRSRKLTLNVIKACVDTAAAKIAKNKTRPIFLTDDGDYELQERAKGLTKYCDGLFDASKVYQAGRRMFVDACVFDTGCIRLFEENGEVRVERVLIDEILIDEDDGRDMKPRQMHHVRYVNRRVLIALFPACKQEILKAPKIVSSMVSTACASDLVKVYDSFHLRSGPDEDDGMRAIFIDGCTLFAERRDKDYLPYIFYRWTMPLVGFHGHSLVEELMGLQIEINRILRQISRAIEGAVPRAFVDNGSMVNIGALTDEIWQIIRYTGRPPEFSPPAAQSPEIYSHLWQLYAKAFEITGVSQMDASAKKQPGLNAAVAIREMSDISSERFVLQGQDLEEVYLDIARIMVDMTRDLAAMAKESGEPGPNVKVVEGNNVETIKWEDVDLDADKYVMRTFPTSLLPTQPAGRLQTVQELVSTGFIEDKEQALELLDFPDTKKFTSLRTAGIENIRWVMSQIMNHRKLIPPTKYMNLKLGLQIAQNELLNAERQGRPQDVQDLIQTWMDQTESLLDEQDAMAAPPPMPAGAAASPAPPGAPMPPGPPPPMNPPMAA